MARKRVKKKIGSRRAKTPSEVLTGQEEIQEGNVDAHGVPIPGKPKQKPKISPEEREYMLERELRRYVKRSGGFRKNLSKPHKEVAKRIMKQLGRKEPEWDTSIEVFGVDQATVARIDVNKS